MELIIELERIVLQRFQYIKNNYKEDNIEDTLTTLKEIQEEFESCNKQINLVRAKLIGNKLVKKRVGLESAEGPIGFANPVYVQDKEDKPVQPLTKKKILNPTTKKIVIPPRSFKAKEKDKDGELNEKTSSLGKGPSTDDGLLIAKKESKLGPLNKLKSYIIIYYQYKGNNADMKRIQDIQNKIQNLRIQLIQVLSDIYIKDVKELKKKLLSEGKTNQQADTEVNKHLRDDLNIPDKQNPHRFKNNCRQAYLIMKENLIEKIYLDNIDEVILSLDRIEQKLITNE